jgi:hypothetical protein
LYFLGNKFFRKINWLQSFVSPKLIISPPQTFLS